MPKAVLRRLLHPSDFSSASRAAFAKAVELAHASGAQLTILHVRPVTLPLMGEGYISPQTYEDLERSAEASARKELDRLVQRAKKRGVRANGLLAIGVAHEQIVRAARRVRADMIVMGTHGRTGISRLFLGSVASRVLSLASCPVLTVRGR